VAVVAAAMEREGREALEAVAVHWSVARVARAPQSREMEQPEALVVRIPVPGRVVEAEALGKPVPRLHRHQKAVMASSPPLPVHLLTTLVVELDSVSMPPHPAAWVAEDHPPGNRQAVPGQQIQEAVVVAPAKTALLEQPAFPAAPAARAWPSSATKARRSAMSAEQ
jgi:hypothetical protein